MLFRSISFDMSLTEIFQSDLQQIGFLLFFMLSVLSVCRNCQFLSQNLELAILRPDFTSKLVHGLAFGTLKIYIAPYGKINHRLVNLSYNCDVKSGLNHAEYFSQH